MIRFVLFAIVLALIFDTTSGLARKTKVALWRRGKLTYGIGRAVSCADVLVAIAAGFAVFILMGWG